MTWKPSPPRWGSAALLTASAVLLLAAASELEPPPPGLDARSIAERAEENSRGQTN